MVRIDVDSDSSLSSILSELGDNGDLDPQQSLISHISSRKRNSEGPLRISKATKKARISEKIAIEQDTITGAKSPKSGNRSRKKAAQPRLRGKKTKEKAALNGTRREQENFQITERSVEKVEVVTVKVEAIEGPQIQTPRPRKRTKIGIIKSERDEDAEDAAENSISIKGKRQKKPKKESQPTGSESPQAASGNENLTPKKTRRKRKTKEEKEAEAMPLAARSTTLRMFIGAHVSCAKGRAVLYPLYIDYLGLRIYIGVHNTVTNALHIG